MTAIAKSSLAFRTIAEASEELDVPAHVLRFWEGKFPQIRPLKRAGGRRHYRPDDMALLRGIRALLQEDGYQLKGVQKLLKDNGVAWVRERGLSGEGQSQDDNTPEPMISLQQRPVRETTEDAGPLFQPSAPSPTPQTVNSAAGIILRQALIKLEKARQILDTVAQST